VPDTPAPGAPALTPAGALAWQRPSVDTAQALDSLNAFAAAGRDFKRSPLGRSVITALELQLDQVRTPLIHCLHVSLTLCLAWQCDSHIVCVSLKGCQG
jgi:hypothetical protein